jgi:hypothetical protein
MPSVRKLAAAACALVACLAHQPGTSLGTYAVTGTLGTQTCGAGVGAVDPWKFDMRLSRSGTTLYWLQPAAPALSGTVTPGGDATIVTSQVYPIQQGDAGPYCGVVRTDTLHASLGAAAQPSSFTGTLSYHYELDQGADCSPSELAAVLDAVPCDVSYDFTAERKSP